MEKFKIITLCAMTLAICQSSYASEGSEECLNAVPTSKISGELFFYYVPSDGPIADKTFITLSKTSGKSGMAKDLAKILKKSKGKTHTYLVCGPSSSKTEQVLKDALSINSKRKRNLSNLTVIFSGKPGNYTDIEKLTENVKATFIFSELE